MPDSEVDVLYGIGGAPEGWSAAAIRALDGDMSAGSLPRHEVKGDSDENLRIGEDELARCEALGYRGRKCSRLNEMARSDNVGFSSRTTKGDSRWTGITRKGNMATTEPRRSRGKSRTILRSHEVHSLSRL
ncbi:fructose-bisphosphatase class II [Shigella flexneri]